MDPGVLIFNLTILIPRSKFLHFISSFRLITATSKKILFGLKPKKINLRRMKY